ncbi:MAG: AAA family ATPase [Oscillospiraceae bacterium]|jgi:DNA helicase-2/ATP-dependent DNA helicase PcrA|nr:AAA family ATPase [Oscillospiraceae bacterium]
MSTIQHPAAREEAAHLAETLRFVAAERMRLQADVAAQAEAVQREKLGSGGIYSSDLIVAENLYHFKEQALHHLTLAADRAYFTRVDFTPEKDHRPRTYYIGKWGVIDGETLSPVIVDWRAPVANLYYAGQLGSVRYTAPDGEVAGMLSLKRQLGVKDGQLQTIFDTDVAAQDAYLMGVLGEARGDRLRDVVSTIQAEQNVVIRHRPDRALVVQGVAGSGKTTIALHRIAYLLYAFRERLKPSQMMILAPNPLFLDYISAVLPDLGVEQVRQTTFARHIAELLGKRMPKLLTEDRLEMMLAASEAARAETAARLRFQGSLRFRELLLTYIDGLERRIVPEGGVAFGPAVLYTHEQMQRIFLEELKPFPFERRIAEIPKYLTRKRKAAQEQAAAWYQAECERRAERLRATMPDGAERRARMVALYDSRDARLEQVKARGKTYEKEEMARWPKLDLLATYADFLSDGWSPPLAEAEKPIWRALCAAKAPLLAKKRAGTEDLAPLALLALRLYGLPRIEVLHTVIDEAQDFSPFQFMLLKELTGGDSFTIVGDLMQGVRSWEGLTAWQEITEPVFEGRATLHPLRVSYRSTVEIMRFAARVAERRPVPGQQQALPVLRHGQPPALHAFATMKARNAFLAETAEALRAEGFSTIAIIERDEKRCAALHKALPEALGARLISGGETHYAGGISILPASLVKGLEFDCVLMADMGATAFPDTELDARLLYVCLTRALHRLIGCHVGEMTGLLGEEV